MNDFTASNGLSVHRKDTGGIRVEYPEYPADPTAVSYIPRLAAKAVTEFVRAEDDERFGRWRWPENPDYAVYAPRPGFHVIGDDPCDLFIVNEMWGSGLAYVDAKFASYGEQDAPFAAAGRAYFDAHPEPKPAWHDAAHNEIWELTTPALGPRAYQVVRTEEAGFRFFLITDQEGFRPGLFPEEAQITAGRPIWPDVTS